MSRHRAFIISLGGYQKVARRLRKSDSTVHAWMSADDGKFPSRLYRAFCALADEVGIPRPGPELFRFLPLPPAPEERAAA
jgi:hypothetical protein